MPRLVKIAATSFLAIIVMTSALARADADPDPPSRVARLSYLSGAVSFQPGGVNDWTDAQLNRPLTSGDRLWTAKDARAELHIGDAALRLNSETSFTLANLDDASVQIQLAQGTLDVRVRQLYENETFEIDTPNLTVNLLRAGEYRIDVDNDRDVSWVTVRSGTAEATGSGQAVTVKPGQQVSFAGGAEKTYNIATAPGRDAFDEWSESRDVREDRAKSAQYVSRDVIGYEDLDYYGVWRTYGPYGAVWVPANVAVGWAPYRFGHWAWVYPWGWTWVDDAPWGFAPFHYGRWVYAPFGWAWVPGPRYVRPVYAPALVAWIGGRNWGVGVSFGGGYGYGWLPLGPREPFIPWYRGSRGYWSRVNVTNTYINNTYITKVYNRYDGGRGCRGGCGDIREIKYVNRRAPNGITVVDRDALIHSRQVSRFAMKVNPDALRTAPVISRLDATPTRASALGGREGSPVMRPPQRAFDRPVLTRTTARRPVPFDMQAKDFAGRSFGPGNAPTSSALDRHYVPRPDAGVNAEPRMRGVDAANARGLPSARAVPKPPDAERTSNNASPRRWPVPRPENTPGGGSVERPVDSGGRGTMSPREPAVNRVPRPPDSAGRSQVRTPNNPERAARQGTWGPTRTREATSQGSARVERRTESMPHARGREQARPARVERSSSAPRQHSAPAPSRGAERTHNR